MFLFWILEPVMFHSYDIARCLCLCSLFFFLVFVVLALLLLVFVFCSMFLILLVVLRSWLLCWWFAMSS